jgi:hypothetical protein
MNRFISTLKSYIARNERPTSLGRWNIDYCNKKMATKIDYSNEDHCGTCGSSSFIRAQAKRDAEELNALKQNELKAKLASRKR